ncbi:hypothetical protein [Tautonia sociabilis]|uniref:Uncharacterized protein n=1 Tax=Tautonia sociabilis TaxID=2080755 RepID=A0A432MHK4_9BACT|nr:hypothetical protein [Tautonia sociabilis]RUL86303.1 hypothetical protein TsocGM_16370 [Tautonia sociabilis]
MLDSIRHPQRARVVLLAATFALLTAARPAPAQLGAAGPYGAWANYGYYGGVGPYGWGPYAYGWAGFTTAGTGPAMPPPGELPDLRVSVSHAPMLRPATTGDLLRQAEAPSWRDRRREALEMHARYDVSTGRPRALPARVPPPEETLERRIAALFRPDGSISWPSGLDSAAPLTRARVEEACRIALAQYRLEGRANLTDIAFARHELTDFAAPVLARLAATNDPLSSQAALDFFQRLDATLIDLADPPAEADDPAGTPAPISAPAPADNAPEAPR